jgi:hypothetical protein
LNHLLDLQPLNSHLSVFCSAVLNDPGNCLVTMTGLLNVKGCSIGRPRALNDLVNRLVAFTTQFKGRRTRATTGTAW